jgi:hypothetical protein
VEATVYGVADLLWATWHFGLSGLLIWQVLVFHIYFPLNTRSFVARYHTLWRQVRPRTSAPWPREWPVPTPAWDHQIYQPASGLLLIWGLQASLGPSGVSPITQNMPAGQHAFLVCCFARTFHDLALEECALLVSVATDPPSSLPSKGIPR